MPTYQRHRPYQFQSRPARRRGRKLLFILAVLSLIAIYCAWALLRPLPALQATPANQTLRYTSPASKLAWPNNTQAAVGIVGSDILDTHGPQVPKPTASTAKVITALVMLDKYHLQPGQQGPSLIITPNDVALYSKYIAQDGSVLPVTVGEKLTLYQMLQALMLPSANNIADSMAIWAYGSLENYSVAANKYLKAHDLASTIVGSDASGLAPDTISTARDLVVIGKLAMQDPVLSSIVGQSTAANIPGVAAVKNVNFLLGTSNIVGVKTGNSEEAGGVYISASKIMLNNKPVTIVTALVNTPDLFSAVQGSLPLIRSAQANFSTVTALHRGAIIGEYNQPWGNKVLIYLSKDLSYTAWNDGKKTTIATNKKSLRNTVVSNAQVGNVVVSSEPYRAVTSVPLYIQHQISQPSRFWRLVHPH